MAPENVPNTKQQNFAHIIKHAETPPVYVT